jgi:transposase
MDRGWLEECLAAGMSLDAIGERAGRHPSTVSYWLKKYGLMAAGQARHAPKRVGRSDSAARVGGKRSVDQGDGR